MEEVGENMGPVMEVKSIIVMYVKAVKNCIKKLNSEIFWNQI